MAHVTSQSETESNASYKCKPVSALSLSESPHTKRKKPDNWEMPPPDLVRQLPHRPRDQLPDKLKDRNIEFLISVAVLCVGYMVIAKEIGAHTDCKQGKEHDTRNNSFIEKLVVGCTFYGIDRNNDHSFDMIRDNECSIPGAYRCAGLLFIADQLQDANSELHKLIKQTEKFEKHPPMEKLVNILSDTKFTKDASAFKTDNSYASFELSFTFATKIFHGRMPLPPCSARLPRIWDMETNTLIPYMDDPPEVVGFISHVWQKGKFKEVTYEDCKDGQLPLESGEIKDSKLKGIQEKLSTVCRYWWMDTLCINKADLAELDMSIRSMHSWYSKASIVAVPSNQNLDVWMSRGWCLQECQAAEALQINREQLPRDGNELVGKLLQMGCMKADMPASLWLSLMESRQTTRTEDKAYALIGLLGIDFYIMYGEEEKAWTRLIERLAIRKGDLSWMVGSLSKTSKHAVPSIIQKQSKNGVNLSWMDGFKKDEVRRDSTCFIPSYIRGNYITPQIAQYPIRVSHVGMKLHVQVFKSNDNKLRALKVAGTDIVLLVQYHTEKLCIFESVSLASGVVFESKVQSVWIARHIKSKL